MKKLLACIFVFILICSATVLPSSAQVYGFLQYDIDAESFFLYSIAPADPFSEEQPQEKVLFIYGFSESFVDDVDEFIIPDEIYGEKIQNVVIRDYNFLNKVVLSDGIKRFTCEMILYDEDAHKIDSREENPITSLHLGKDFLAEGLDGCKTKHGRLENLETVTVSEENPYLNTHNGAVYTEDYKTLVYCPPRFDKKTFTLKSGTKVISEGAFASSRYIQNIKRIEKVERIGSQAFRGTKKIKKMVIGDKIKEIPAMAFYNSSIHKITLGKNVEIIGNSAFEKSGIKNIVLGGKIKELGYQAFSESDIEQITIGKKIKKLNSSTFARSNLKKIILKGKVKLGRLDSTFSGCKHVAVYASSKASAKYLQKYFKRVASSKEVKGVKIYVNNKLYCNIKNQVEKLVIDNVKRIYNQEFCNTNIKEITIGGKVKTIGQGAFDSSKVEKVTIGKDVEVIEREAFSGSELRRLTINGETTIGEWAFINTKLEKVTVNAKIEIDQGLSSFSGCKDVEFFAKNKEIAKSLYDQLKQNNITSCKIFVGYKELYSIRPNR